MPTWGSLYFQNSSSAIMEQLIFFHDHTMMIMIMIMILVGYMLISSCMNKFYNLGLFEGQEMESIWTILPAIFLLFIAFPSIRLLYLMEEFEQPELSIKVLGHQWFWSYEYSDLGIPSFDSYMTSSNNIFRLLDVDNCLVIPYDTDIRMIVSSSDVIHSWTIPSLGVKVDAIPGRLNQLSFLFNRVGMFVGQCSEICGANHSFMPVVISVIPRMEFLNLIK
uniref:Cytochrome c oxidase subunit 2 n=1 Tax=Trichonephila clavata TaxID=2740835 RepID=Q1JQQ4_TRICU|nr:cytochrome c oxidase subunit II [Trichonephila clavata]AAS15721.1 cytochrome oxidase subunit 2 [Trichonephila clavata]UQJ77479.1 cytochrome c oxidase subunit II [Trichonephila clavata]